MEIESSRRMQKFQKSLNRVFDTERSSVAVVLLLVVWKHNKKESTKLDVPSANLLEPNLQFALHFAFIDLPSVDISPCKVPNAFDIHQQRLQKVLW